MLLCVGKSGGEGGGREVADGRREVVRRPGAADAALTPAPVCLAHDPRRSRCEDETRAPQGALAVATPTRGDT